jgi:two-component system, chemotaxis family, chemotaxis protein CheY
MTRPSRGNASQASAWTAVDAAPIYKARSAVQQAGLHDPLQEPLQGGRLEHAYPLPERRTVLVVDDEPSIVELIAEVLEEAGYRTLMARNARTALVIARHEQPALVLTDRNMPEIDGVEFVRHLRASVMTARIPVVIMSSTRPDVETTGDVPFLAKPFDLDDMLNTVATYAGPPIAQERTLHG